MSSELRKPPHPATAERSSLCLFCFVLFFPQTCPGIIRGAEGLTAFGETQTAQTEHGVGQKEDVKAANTHVSDCRTALWRKVREDGDSGWELGKGFGPKATPDLELGQMAE